MCETNFTKCLSKIVCIWHHTGFQYKQWVHFFFIGVQSIHSGKQFVQLIFLSFMQTLKFSPCIVRDRFALLACNSASFFSPVSDYQLRISASLSLGHSTSRCTHINNARSPDCSKTTLGVLNALFFGGQVVHVMLTCMTSGMQKFNVWCHVCGKIWLYSFNIWHCSCILHASA